MNDKDYEHLMDAMGGTNEFSSCCSAKVYLLGDSAICTDCKEHCDVVTEEE